MLKLLVQGLHLENDFFKCMDLAAECTMDWRHKGQNKRI